MREEAAAEAAMEGERASAEEALSERLDQLQSSTDSGADHVRNLYIAFLAFAAYLAVTIGGTTDEQLLRSGPVRLPILNVDLPLFAFFWIAPALFVLFHFNLLTQLCLLAEKLRALDQAIKALSEPGEQTQRRLRLNMFVFSHMLIGQQDHPLLRRLLTLMAWTTFVVLPVLVLLLAQIRFVPYHDAWTTWWHRGLVFLDLLLLWLLWTQAILPKIQILRRLVYMRQRWRQLRASLGDRWRRLHAVLANPLDWPAWPVIGFLALVQAIVMLPERIWRRLRHEPKRDGRLLRLQGITVAALVVAFLVATIPGEFLAKPLDALMGPETNPPLIARNLVVVETNLVDVWPTQAQIDQFGEDGAWRKVGKPINLKGRDLRYGRFSDSAFERADLRDANLQGAELWEANLQGANLEGANLQRAILQRANLQGADLTAADLRDAFLAHATLQGATSGCSPGGGRCADLRGAILRGAYLQVARLRGVNARLADFFGANLQGADLSDSGLQGTNLGGASLEGAVFRGASLEGADLRTAHLWRATIGRALDRDQLWRLADLRGADVVSIDDVDALISKLQEHIAHHWTRILRVGVLRAALRNEESPDHPEWSSKPDVMFEAGTPLANALGWDDPMPEEEYDQKLASFLGEFACGEEGNEHVARGIAGRALDEPDRLFAKQLAARLTTPACAPAKLPDDIRADLKRLAGLARKSAPANTQVPILPGGRSQTR